MQKLQNIKNLTREKLREWFKEKTKTYKKNHSFRADQVFYWLYKRKVQRFSEMKNIGHEICALLEENFYISSMKKLERNSISLLSLVLFVGLLFSQNGLLNILVKVR